MTAPFLINQDSPGGRPFGYGTAPGQTGLGYYEQQTPAGSFVASQGAQMPGQQMATAQGAAAQGSVMPYAQQVAGYAQQSNPYLSRTTQQAGAAGTNQFAGAENPYLSGVIGAATSDATRAFNTATMPQFDRMQQQSGSFGNTGVQQMQGQAISDFGRNLGNIASGMRMQDYTQQQQLAENQLNRNQQLNQFNATLGANDLSRQTGGVYTGQALGLQGLNSLVGAAQFDANLGNNIGQFNAGAQNQMSMFNAGQGNAMGQAQAGMNQQNSMFNAGQGNAMLSGARDRNFTGQQNQLNRDQSQSQFNDQLDYNIYRGNTSDARNSFNDQMSWMSYLNGMNNQAGTSATNIQNTPLNYLQQFTGMGTQLGGQGGTATQQMQGNPYLGALGGLMTGGQLYNSYFGGGR